MNFEKWVYTYLGKPIDYDKMYDVQCVDLFNHYCVNCLGLKIGYFPNSAKDFWNNRNNVKWLKDNFTFIDLANIKRGNVKKGDIGIRTTGTHGHIFIIDGQYKYNTITIYDQNHSGKHEPMTKRDISINGNINGILRPRNMKPLHLPSYNAGSQYILTANINVWERPNFKNQVERLNASDYAIAHSVNTKYLVLKENTVIDALEVIKDSNHNIWIRIYSGWIVVYYKGDKRANWFKE